MKRKKGSLLIGAGVALLSAAVCLAAFNLYDNYRAGRAAQQSVSALEAAVVPAATPQIAPVDPAAGAAEIEIPDYQINPQMEMPVRRQNGQDYIGILEIPALEMKLPVISQWSYPKLRVAPCRYAGSVYTKDMVISAHNYASHFGALSKLYEGAAVIFTDMDGNVFRYRVELIETLNPDDVEYMTDSGWDLTLFTCTPGGSYRVTVRCALRGFDIG